MITISRVATLMAILVLSTPKATNPITTSMAATKSAHGVPIHFERKDAIEANLSESCRFIWRVHPQVSAHGARVTGGGSYERGAYSWGWLPASLAAVCLTISSVSATDLSFSSPLRTSSPQK